MKTKAKKSKKVVKPVKASRRKVVGVHAVIPYSQILTPEVFKGKYSVVPTTFSIEQLQQIIAKTPEQVVKTRPGKGGMKWDYVPGWWFKKKLNFVFGFSWDFEILGERIDGDFVTVKGKLTVRHPKTGNVQAIKVDFGGHEIKYKQGTKNYLDISNDFKAAATDSLKRCAVQLGLAMDIYGKNEMVSEGVQVVDTPPKMITGTTSTTTYRPEPLDDMSKWKDCQGNCGAKVSPMTEGYSKKMFKKILCRDCQEKLKQRG